MELNKIYNENCLDSMAKMPENFLDLTVTSPPYDNLRDYNGYSFDFEKIAGELFRVTKIGGVVVWVVGDATIKGSETGTSFKQALYFKEIGFNLHDTMIYAKNSYAPLNHNRYEQQFEYMFVFSKGKPIIFNPLMIATLTCGKGKKRNTSKGKEKNYAVKARDQITIVKPEKPKPNIWFYNVGENDRTAHNAPFPEGLARDHILSWSNPTDLIYDPFMGSGTVVKMAKILNRNFIGSEISKEYCEISEKRLSDILL